MARDDTFKDYVMDNLADLQPVRCRPMFGGHGFYLADRFFGIIYRGRLYFRTDDSTRAAYVGRGAVPFRPRTGQGLAMYFEVPAEIVDDPDQLTAWARRAAATRQPGKTGRTLTTRRRRGRSGP
jgi:DNA transformation protein and related proteins